MSKVNQIPENIKQYAKKYEVTVRRDTVYCEMNHAASADGEIFLGDFNNPEIEIGAFFHELGHIMIGREMRRGFYMSKISQEGWAWEKGLELAHENGFEWSYEGNIHKWARQQLRSYIGGEYDDTLEKETKMSDQKASKAEELVLAMILDSTHKIENGHITIDLQELYKLAGELIKTGRNERDRELMPYINGVLKIAETNPKDHAIIEMLKYIKAV